MKMLRQYFFTTPLPIRFPENNWGRLVDDVRTYYSDKDNEKEVQVLKLNFDMILKPLTQTLSGDLINLTC